MDDLLAPLPQRYVASDLDVDLGLTLPTGLHGLLDAMLSGWTRTSAASDRPQDITVSGEASFTLTSPHYQSGRSYSDIVSILNEVLVSLAYAVRHQRRDAALIHAAGFAEGRKATVLFGARKAGKSVMTARKAAAGARIWADDLLLWEARHQAFRGIGISPRLRRPVLPDILSALDETSLIVGQYTCYIAARAIDLAPAGTILRPDHLMELQADQTLQDIPLRDAMAEIGSHRIP